MTDDQIYQILSEYSQYFNTNNIFSNIVRSLGWMIIKFMKWLVDQCENLFSMTIGLLDFTQYSSVRNFLNQFQGLFVVLMGISLIAIGTMYIVNWEKKPRWIQLVQNIIIGFFFITSSFYLLGKINTILVDGTDAVTASYNAGESSASLIVKDNLYDLYYINQKYSNGLADISNKGMLHYDSLEDSDIDIIDYSEIINIDSSQLKSTSTDLLKKRILFTQENLSASDKLEDVTYSHFGITWLGNGYYRYSFQFFTAIITFISFLIIYIILSYKVVRFIWEIIMGQFLGILYAADITSSQKILKTLDCIKNAYVMILLSTICMKFFLLMQTYLNNIEPFKSNTVVRAFLILFSAFALADGPNIVEKMTGYDAGLSSGFGKMYALMRASSMPLHLGASAINAGVSFSQQQSMKNAMNTLSQSMNGAAPPQSKMDDTNQSAEHKTSQTNNMEASNDLNSNQQDINDRETSMNQDLNSSESSTTEMSQIGNSENDINPSSSTTTDNHTAIEDETMEPVTNDNINEMDSENTTPGQEIGNTTMDNSTVPDNSSMNNTTIDSAENMINSSMDDYVNQSLGESNQMESFSDSELLKPNTTYAGNELNLSQSFHKDTTNTNDLIEKSPSDIPFSSKDHL